MISKEQLDNDLHFWAREESKIINELVGYSTISPTAKFCQQLKVGIVVRGTQKAEDREPCDRLKEINAAVDSLTKIQRLVIKADFQDTGNARIKAHRLQISRKYYYKVLCIAKKELRLIL